MPLQSLGLGKYRWGDAGKVYSGDEAKAKAERQGRAIEASKAREKKKQ